MHQGNTIMLALVISPLFAACDQIGGKHEIVRAGNQTFLLNKATGETRLLEGTSMLVVTAPAKNPNEEVVKQAKSWPEQNIPQLGNIKLAIRTKYRDGNMLYSVEAKPFSGRLEREYTPSSAGIDYLRKPTLFVDFYDSDGFQTGPGIELEVRGATRIVSEKGEVGSLSWTGSQPMSAETYRAAAYQSVRWSGFAKEGPEPPPK